MLELVKLMAAEGVRSEQNDDNPTLSLFAVIDCIQHSANKKDQTYKTAKSKWDRLIAEDSEYKDELLSLTVMINVRHHTNGTFFETPGMTVIGLKILLFILGGKVAMEFRRTVDSFFTRFIAGDESLVAEIRANAANNSIMHKTFREALQLEPMRNASASNNEQEVVKGPLDTLLGKRTLQTDDDLQLVDKALTLHERAFEVHQKIEHGKIELQKKKALAELDVKKAQEEVQLALRERKKYPDQWGQLGLRQKQIELQERQFKLNVEMRDKNIQMPQKTTTYTKSQKLSPPTSNRPVSAANMPSPSSKEKAPEQRPPSSKEKTAGASVAPTPVKEKACEKPPPQKDIHKPTSSRAKKGVTVKQARTVIHLAGQTRISFPTTPRF
jgi:hypothetical protein